MELLLNLLPVTTAHANSLDDGLFGMIVTGSNMVVGILKWAALLYVVIKITMLGFKIATTSKTSAESIGIVKNEGAALAIGFFIVMAAFTIQTTMANVINKIGTSPAEGTTVDWSDGDNWKKTP